jgi:hypothetical protein
MITRTRLANVDKNITCAALRRDRCRQKNTDEEKRKVEKKSRKAARMCYHAF